MATRRTPTAGAAQVTSTQRARRRVRLAAAAGAAGFAGLAMALSLALPVAASAGTHPAAHQTSLDSLRRGPCHVPVIQPCRRRVPAAQSLPSSR